MKRDELLKCLLKIPADQDVKVLRSGSKRPMTILSVIQPRSGRDDEISENQEPFLFVDWSEEK